MKVALQARTVCLRRGARRSLLVVTALALIAAFPSGAQAHGPVAPVASSFVAKPTDVPSGLQAKVIDGDQSMWLTVAAGKTVVLLDPRGAPYLRFTAAGVEVNHNSVSYLLNQSPAVQTPPPTGLGSAIPPRWHRVSTDHAYSWHEGRLHALAAVAHPSASAYLGRWSVPLLLDGRLTAVRGSVWYAEPPSLVWFWPIVVLLACLLAALRIRRSSLDLLLARSLSFAALIAILVAGAARELHGRPSLSPLGLAGLAVTVLFVGWALHQVINREPGYFSCFAIAFVAAWEGAALIPTLLDGFTLLAVPATVARATTVVCLGCSVALLVLSFRLGRRADSPAAQRPTPPDPALAEESFA